MENRQKVDGVRLAILSNRWEGIARKMANTLLRTGRSGVLATARDFSCCVVTADCRLLATAESIPIHVLSGPDLMAKAMKELHPELKPGDAFLHNSPYHGCSHAADLSILVPIFDGKGRHRYTAVVKAHQADIGNSLPTTYMGAAKDVYNEGALIFAATQVQRDYKDIEDIIRLCRLRIRVPDQWWGDYLGMVGAARIAEREVINLAAEIGWDELDQYVEDWFEYSETLMAAAIRKLPAGKVTKSSTHDPTPGTPSEGIKINATVTVDPAAARITVDLRDNIDSLPCGLNVSEACTRTAAMIGVLNAIPDDVPRNAGAFRRLDILLREGGVVGTPKHPTSCSVATTNVADRITNPVQTAIAELSEHAGQAEAGAILPGTMAVVSGVDPRRNRAFVNQLFVVHTGGAASPTQDAWITIAHAGNAGMLYQDSIEVSELHYPLRVYDKRLVTDTEGAGTYNGAPSSTAEYGPVDCSMDVNFVSDGTQNPPRGVRGGGTGGNAQQYRRRVDGTLEPLPGVTSTTLAPGERILAVTCGGGGFGSPLKRDPQRVAHNAREGWITRERAARVYGVVLDEKFQINENETRRKRAELAEQTAQ
ncbi:hydantoinase B/oxoprolinase family protein [Taklimakanibacter deserti]|uniref:hydantoinase B/oxoprolinase family protein n=1 Tax=Taklimakanibacter deserti TaxID=2267839 RepID=UPI000E6553A4